MSSPNALLFIYCLIFLFYVIIFNQYTYRSYECYNFYEGDKTNVIVISSLSTNESQC